MHKYSLPFSIIIVGALVATLHITALSLHLYFVYSWFDIMMHFIGGLLAAMFGVWLYEKFGKEALKNDVHYNVLFNVVIFVTIVGLLWESFELLLGLTLDNRVLYVEDTILDFVMNTIGAVAGYFYACWIIKKSQ